MPKPGTISFRLCIWNYRVPVLCQSLELCSSHALAYVPAYVPAMLQPMLQPMFQRCFSHGFSLCFSFFSSHASAYVPAMLQPMLQPCYSLCSSPLSWNSKGFRLILRVACELCTVSE